jgi:hypothetical protein
MKVVFPRVAKGVHFPDVFEVTMNEFDVERLLPSLFYLVVTKGRPRAARVNKPTEIDQYLASLASHERLVGFDSPSGLRLLDRWIRASVIHVGMAGRAKQKGEQIEYVIPRTLLSYKTGLPQQEQRQRGVHLFIYHQLRRTLDEASSSTPSDELLRDLFVRTFGRGVELGDGPTFDGRFDGATTLDLETLLSLYYLDGFQPTPARAAPKEAPGVPALPGLAKAMSTDLIAYLGAYRDQLPVLALTRGLMALINLELYAYTIKLAYAVDEVVSSRDIPAVFGGETSWGPDIYVDFTRARRSVSHRLARSCFERELEQMRRMFEHLIRLRTISRYCASRPQVSDELALLNASDKAAFLVRLLEVAENPWIEARADTEFDQVIQDSLEPLENEQERDEMSRYLDSFRRSNDSSLIALVALLVAEQQRTQVEPLLKWLVSVGGLKKEFGLLVGTSRADAAYVMSDDLLVTLVHVLAAEQPGFMASSDGTESKIPLASFLAFLEDRFGILVDRPPKFLDDGESRAAARENLGAMKRRLREMGFFSDLSDDFDAQYLTVLRGANGL